MQCLYRSFGSKRLKNSGQYSYCLQYRIFDQVGVMEFYCALVNISYEDRKVTAVCNRVQAINPVIPMLEYVACK